MRQRGLGLKGAFLGLDEQVFTKRGRVMRGRVEKGPKPMHFKKQVYLILKAFGLSRPLPALRGGGTGKESGGGGRSKSHDYIVRRGFGILGKAPAALQ